jgi:4-amino-4-deoxy-L-arabinose transferase-like glycosyltransferase
MNNVEVIEIKNFNLKRFTLYLQIFLSILLLIFGIITMFFNQDFLMVVYILLSLVLFTMAWNNHKIHKRKYMTILYIMFGFVTLVSFIVEIL